MKKNVYLIFSVIFAVLTVVGLAFAVPLFIIGESGDSPDDVHGIASLFGFILMIPTVISGLISILFSSIHKKKAIQQ